ncbi:hypothetical protein [Vibrio sp. TRT 1302]|uniref:hypothetical protein n=1 Tax=Vibrio sp. TRT 1302 TaxID=3418504 RepID=UPI003CEE3CF1
MNTNVKPESVLIEDEVKKSLAVAQKNGDDETAQILKNWLVILPTFGPLVGQVGPVIYSPEELEDLFIKLTREYRAQFLNEKSAGRKITAAITAGAILLNAVGPYIAMM